MRNDQFPKPFWRASRNAWFVQLNGKQIRLSTNKDEAFRLYHELMSRKPEQRRVAKEPSALTVIEVIDLFLEWAEKNRERPTYEGYKRRLQHLVDAIPAKLPSGDLKPYHLTRVMDSKDWMANTKNDFAAAVNRAYNWAVRQGLIDRNPVVYVEKPAREIRELAISPQDYAEVMVKVREVNFRTLLELAWETGARPQELRKIEARYHEPENHRLIFPPKESKGKKYHRVIYLGTDRAREIITQLGKRHPNGPILRNAKGKPWTRESINCAFCRLQTRIGRKLHLGAWRKGYATEALKAGIDTVSVAALLGHRDGTMVSRIYGRVQCDPHHMAEMARRAKRKP